MAIKKVKYLTLLIGALIIFLSNDNANAQNFNWHSVTFLGEVRETISYDSKIWAATSGGLFSYDINTEKFQIYTNTSGLSSNDVSAIYLSNNILWIGLNDGTLNYIDLATGDLKKVFIDTDPVLVNDLIVVENEIYIATDFGITLYLIDKDEINSTFRTLGNFNTNLSVNKLIIHEGIIWAGTALGVASADLNSPNLQDPQFWTNYNLNNFQSTKVNSLDVLNGAVLATFGGQIALFSNNEFTLLNELKNPDGSYLNIRDVLVVGESDYIVASNSGVYRFQNSVKTLISDIFNVLSINQDGSGNILLGHNKNGLYINNVNVFPMSPRGESFEQVIIGKDRRMWAASGLGASYGLYMRDGGEWKTYTSSDGLSSNSTIGVAEDDAGNIWVGTPGAGAMVISDSGTGISVREINNLTNELAGSDTENFVIVSKIKKDNTGNMWLVNKFANNGKALAISDTLNKWNYFSTADGLSDTKISDIDFDEFNRVWVSYDTEGISMLDHNGTLDNKLDDIWRTYKTSDGLISDHVIAIAVDNEHGVWVGTRDGINFILDGFPPQYIFGSLDNYINVIFIDAVNNKWFGTPSGISILGPDNFTWTHFTKENSELLDNNIISIYVDDITGDAYIGTSKGLSIISTPFRKPPDSFKEIGAYPNPFLIDGSGKRLTIENLLLNSRVKIFTSSGRFVKSLTSENRGVLGTQAFWDGTDQNGKLVPSGVYIVAGSNDEKKHGLIKVAVIRK